MPANEYRLWSKLIPGKGCMETATDEEFIIIENRLNRPPFPSPKKTNGTQNTPQGIPCLRNAIFDYHKRWGRVESAGNMLVPWGDIVWCGRKI